MNSDPKRIDHILHLSSVNAVLRERNKYLRNKLFANVDESKKALESLKEEPVYEFDYPKTNSNACNN